MCKRNIRWLPLARPQPGTWSASQACAQTRKWTRDLSVRGMLLNMLGHTSQGRTILYPHRWTFPPWNTMTQTLWGTKGELLVDLLSHAGHVFLFLGKQLSTCISRLSLSTITRGKIFNCSYPITPRRETPRRAEIAQLYSQHLDWCLTRSRCRTRMTEWMSEKLKYISKTSGILLAVNWKLPSSKDMSVPRTWNCDLIWKNSLYRYN